MNHTSDNQPNGEGLRRSDARQSKSSRPLSNVPLSNVQLYVGALILTVSLELLTCFARFGLKMKSSRDTASALSGITFGFRVHHGYLGGILMIVSVVFWNRSPRSMSWCLVIGLGLFFSDLIHHFLILWPIVGSPQFDFTYPVKSE